MADIKISALSAATTPVGTEELPVVQGGSTVKATVDDIALKSKTLAELNVQVSDATLVDTGDSRFSDSRTPNTHDLHGAEHDTCTLAQLNTKVSDASLARADATQTFTGAQNTGVTTLTPASPTLIDAEDNGSYVLTLDAARQLDNPTNLVAGMGWVVRVIQGGAGTFALTFDTFYEFGAAGAPDTSADATADERLLTFYAITSTRVLCVDSIGVY